MLTMFVAIFTDAVLKLNIELGAKIINTKGVVQEAGVTLVGYSRTKTWGYSSQRPPPALTPTL